MVFVQGNFIGLKANVTCSLKLLPTNTTIGQSSSIQANSSAGLMNLSLDRICSVVYLLDPGFLGKTVTSSISKTPASRQSVPLTKFNRPHLSENMCDNNIENFTLLESIAPAMNPRWQQPPLSTKLTTLAASKDGFGVVHSTILMGVRLHCIKLHILHFTPITFTNVPQTHRICGSEVEEEPGYCVSIASSRRFFLTIAENNKRTEFM